MPTLASEAGISTSTFQLWKQKGEEQTRGKYSAFSAHLKKAESDYRAYYLKKIQDAARESSVETRKTVQTIGEGDGPGGRRNYATVDHRGKEHSRIKCNKSVKCLLTMQIGVTILLHPPVKCL